MRLQHKNCSENLSLFQVALLLLGVTCMRVQNGKIRTGLKLTPQGVCVLLFASVLALGVYIYKAFVNTITEIVVFIADEKSCRKADNYVSYLDTVKSIYKAIRNDR